MLVGSYSHSSPPSPNSVCYFTLPASRNSFDTVDETPFASPLEPYTLPETPSDPSHPLLALRVANPQAERRPKMDASRLLSLQTSAAYASRPQPQPVQGNQQTSSLSSSAGSNDSNGSLDADLASPALARCCRCHRSTASGSDPTKTGMVSFGTNLYYCARCASLVGYNR